MTLLTREELTPRPLWRRTVRLPEGRALVVEVHHVEGALPEVVLRDGDAV